MGLWYLIAMNFRRQAVCIVLLGMFVAPAMAQEAPAPEAEVDRKVDVIYGRLPGAALTMDVFAPNDDATNGAGVIWIVSGGWASSHEAIEGHRPFIQVLVERGYTVFAVVHASQPKYTITEILPQINRAVRFVRYHADDLGIDADRLGICGISAGGHLSLMQAFSPQPPDEASADPVERTPATVQAVAAFVPPTDFLNFGAPGVISLGKGPLDWLRAPFDFHDAVLHPSTFGGEQVVYERITDENRLEAIGREISPIYGVDPADPPTLVLHGEVDRVVPVQQAQSLKEALDAAGVANELIVRSGADHIWPEMIQDVGKVADWFDRHLAPE